MPLLRALIFGLRSQGGVVRISDEAVTASTVGDVLRLLSSVLCVRFVPHEEADIKGIDPEWFQVYEGEVSRGLVGVQIERDGAVLRPRQRLDFALTADDRVVVSSVA